jgi:hypothetical protein
MRSVGRIAVCWDDASLLGAHSAQAKTCPRPSAGGTPFTAITLALRCLSLLTFGCEQHAPPMRVPTQMVPTWAQWDRLGRRAALRPHSGFVIRDTWAGLGVWCRRRAGLIT